MTSEGTRTREKIYIIGHKNPDTDSICSAIAYTELKKAVLERKLADGTFEAEKSFAGRDAGPDPGIYRLPGRDRQ